MLEFNVKHDFLFFRMSSDFIPYASHPLMNTLVTGKKKFKWQEHFGEQLFEIGNFIRKHGFRISMHPNYLCVLNATEEALKTSITELEYHADLFECMQLDNTHKFQIHCGGIFDDKQKSLEKLVERYHTLSERVKKHLVFENDDHYFSLDDCIWVHERTGVPILFDTLHHECLNTSGETQRQAFKRAASTWNKKDGLPMIDYSSQSTQGGSLRGEHTESIDLKHFEKIICKQVMRVQDDPGNVIPFDTMLEIKDKEISGLKCIKMFQEHRERYHGPSAEKIVYTEEEKENEVKEVGVQARISNRDEKGEKVTTSKKEKVKHKKLNN